MRNKARYWLIPGFVIFWIEYLVLYMYRRSFVIKTYFDLFSIFSDGFPRFNIAFGISIELVSLT